jgi:hypothetical protein
VNAIDPFARKVGEDGQVLSRRQPLRLKAAHLAGRGPATKGRLAADDPPHRRIMAQALGVVHVLVSREATEDGLSEQPGQGVAAILAGAVVGQNLARYRRQADRVVKFAIGKQPSIGGDDRTAKLHPQAAVEIEPQGPVI